MTLSKKESLVIELLKGEPPQYGLQLVERSDGGLKRGTVYVTLGRMLDKGLVTVQRDDDQMHSGLPRPRYQPTAMALRLLAARRAYEAALEGGS